MSDLHLQRELWRDDVARQPTTIGDGLIRVATCR